MASHDPSLLRDVAAHSALVVDFARSPEVKGI